MTANLKWFPCAWVATALLVLVGAGMLRPVVRKGIPALRPNALGSSHRGVVAPDSSCTASPADASAGRPENHNAAEGTMTAVEIAAIGPEAATPVDERLRRLLEAWSATIREEQRDYLAEVFAASMDPELIPDLLGQLPDGLPEPLLVPLQRNLIRRLTRGDTLATTALVESLPPGLSRDTVRLQIAVEYAGKGVSDVAAWVAGWDEGAVKKLAVQAMEGELARAK